MWSFDRNTSSNRLFRAALAIMLVFGLAACQFRPLYEDRAGNPGGGPDLSTVAVSQVNSRVAQQVRNHLIFLLHGNSSTVKKTHEARIRVSFNNKLLAAIEGVQDSTSGTITVTVTYDLVDLSTGKAIGSGSRQAQAFYDRTGQVFANERAERDAENRAAKQVAEFLRLAIASDLGSGLQ